MFDCNKNNTILIIFISNFLFISEQLKKKKVFSFETGNKWQKNEDPHS